MRQKAVSLLQELTEAHSVSGHEDEVRAIFVDEMEGCGNLSTDKNGSVFCETDAPGPRVLIAGHMDEVGFMVQSITLDGFISFVAVGGWWEHNLLAQRVEVLTRSGEKIHGVVASKPPHQLTAAQRSQVMTIDQLFIDIGATSRREAQEVFGVSLGDPIAPWSPFTPMKQKDWFMAKAFDNRVGMAGAIQAGQILTQSTYPNRLIFGGTVQEEVGLRGAKTAANYIKPDVAIVLEGPPADDTPGMSHADSQGRLGGGVQIRMFDPSAIMNPRLAHLAIDTARKEGISHQIAMRRAGGTDAGSFHLANEGVPSIVLGVPARYIHSHNAIIDLKDYECMVNLAVALAKKLDQTTVDELTRYL
ncbi:M42 family metallopeptidase [Luteolibacter pohnpeiensis]|uniref:M42 family metallopeptidase n=1 Tax=Luteolibacter pohnpeiensis TaxID=454153 RepID=A0A934SC63_9BACT|nr:M42 family metallopeptidase [Luteolibacter pohnpeiensis]MBK1883467.1 M42 family metallopeptidase [Luteolibacter pohnpeiensis]